MTTDEALRMVSVDSHKIDSIKEKNKIIREKLKQNGIPFAELSPNIPDSYMVTEPLLKLYATGREAQAVLCQHEYFAWLAQQNQMDINGNMEGGGKAQEEKVLEEILKHM